LTQNWKKSLELDPTDEKLKQFVDKMEKEKTAAPIEGLDFLNTIEKE